MPEPERDIEKILRACAKKRREEAGAAVEMHPATRRLLHGEIARSRHSAPHKSGFWTRIFGSSWPQIAVRVSVLVLLVSTAAFFLLPFLSKPKTELATLRLRDKQMLIAKQPDREGDGNTLKDLPLSKKDRASGATLLNGRESSLKSEKASAGETRFAVTPPTSVSSAEKNKFVAGAGIDSSAPKTLPDSPQADSGAISGLVTNGTANPSRRALTITQEYSDSSSAPTGAVATAPAAAAPAPAIGQSDLIASANTTSSSIQPLAPPPAATALSSDSLVAANREPLGMNLDASGASANSVTQRFIRTVESAKMRKTLKSPGKIVLNSFRVIQTGNQIQVIDSDGSIYSGTVGQADEAEKLASAPVESVAASGVPQGNATFAEKAQTGQNKPLSIGGAAGTIQPVQNYFFRVSGTNHTLKQSVVFSGNLVSAPPTPPSAKSSPVGKPARGTTPEPTTGPAQLQSLNSQLHGRAVIGGTNQIEINALPVKP